MTRRQVSRSVCGEVQLGSVADCPRMVAGRQIEAVDSHHPSAGSCSLVEIGPSVGELFLFALETAL